MPVIATIQRAAPVALAILEDPRVTGHLDRAGSASRKALRARKRPARRSPLQRLSEAVSETFNAGLAAKAVAERRERSRRRRRIAGVLVAAAGAAGTAFAVRRSTDATTASTP
jgi:hypothetical protein